MGKVNKWDGVDVGLMTVHDVAGVLHLGENHGFPAANHGQVPEFRLGKSWRSIKETMNELDYCNGGERL